MLAIIIEYLLDCLWVLVQGVIGLASIMLIIIAAATIRTTWHELKQRMEERAEEKWKKQ